MKRGILKGKRVILGVTGSIAAFKSAELSRLLRREGADVRAVFTENGRRFITPLSLSVLSGNPAYSSMFVDERNRDMKHISLAENCDLLLIAPASADIIAKIAAGIADDLLTTLALAVRKPVLIAPAMNDAMLDNPATAENIETLKRRGIFVMEPGEGELASGRPGKGRMPEPPQILEEAERVLTVQDMSGISVLVTAGPTREPLDAVRFISNPSLGKMGFETARAAARRGARTVLVSGPVEIPPPPRVRLVSVETSMEMLEAVNIHFEGADAVVMAAAVSDYRPRERFEGKVNKSGSSMVLELVRNPDILKELGKKKGNRVLAGFSMDVGEHKDKAEAKLREKNLDFIVVNDISAEGAGFGCDTNIISVLSAGGRRKDYPEMLKSEAADIILDEILARMAG